FAGGFTLDLARAALGDALVTLAALAALVDHSLVQRVERGVGEPRFMLLEVVRLYALERLTMSGQEQATRQRWAEALLRLAEQAAQALHGPEQRAWLDRLDAERSNLNALLAWSLDSTITDRPDADVFRDIGARLVTAQVPFWWRRGYGSEGQRWVTAALARASGTTIQ